MADVGGLEGVKRKLNTAFLGPLRRPELRQAYGKSLRGGLLLYRRLVRDHLPPGPRAGRELHRRRAGHLPEQRAGDVLAPQTYLSVPLVNSEGAIEGTLCGVSRKPFDSGPRPHR